MNWHLQEKLKRFGAEFDSDSNTFVLQGNAYPPDMDSEQARGLVLALEIQWAKKHGHMAVWPE